MPVTLAEAAPNTQDDVDRLVIDEFRKQSALLDSLLFHDTVNPMGGGSTLTYGYHRVITERAAAFRAINAEYTPAEAAKDRFTVDLKPLGGAFHRRRLIIRSTQVSTIPARLSGTWTRSRRRREAVGLLAELPLAQLCTHVFAFDRAAEAFRAVDQGKPGLMHAILDYDRSAARDL